MQRPPLRRILVTALLLATLAAPAAWADGSSAQAYGAAGFSSLLDLLHRIRGGLVSLWAGNGAGIDPSGGPATDNSDNGAGIDPDGGRAANQEGNLASDNGCGIDPHGGCRVAR
jgi:hypothetical protein